jgi:hypothetical protein
MGFKTGSFISVGNRGLNPTNSLERTRRVNNPVWNFAGPHTFQGTVAGYSSRGTVINKFPFATNANATDVGNLISDREAAGQSSDVSGYVSGGYASNVIEKFPFASNGNSTDVADLTLARRNLTGQSSSVNGYNSGGNNPPGHFNVIDKFPFAADANATDVGDLTMVRTNLAGQSSAVSGYSSGGFSPASGTPNGATNRIDKFPFATNANATDVADLTNGTYRLAGQSSDVSGYATGGTGNHQRIDKFPFATDSNAASVGNITVGPRIDVTGQSSTASGYTTGGYFNISGYTSSNIIEKFPFATDAGATDVADLSAAQRQGAGQQD